MSIAYRNAVNQLAANRRAHRVSQYDLARRCGHTAPWLGSIERFHRVVDAPTLHVIQRALSEIVAERREVSAS
jgi:transcriptional regulator with XRE-family HTH domain